MAEGRALSSAVPPQPVPPLDQTLREYLQALEPLLPPDEFQHTQNKVLKFGQSGGLGPRLQEGLLRRARTSNNWVKTRLCFQSMVKALCILCHLHVIDMLRFVIVVIDR